MWFDVSRTFVGLSVILLFSLTPVSCYLHYQDDRREDVLILTVYGVFAGQWRVSFDWMKKMNELMGMGGREGRREGRREELKRGGVE